MTKELCYQSIPSACPQLNHCYGEKVHLISNPWTLSLLAKVCHGDTLQPAFNNLITALYSYLLEQAANTLFPTTVSESPTRMKAYHAEGVYCGVMFDQNQRFVTVDIARAGTLPSQTVFDHLHYYFNPAQIRQDHFYLNRRVNEKGQVVGVDMSGSKIGGDVEGAIMLIPDPMGATGGTVSHTVNYYQKQVEGKAKKIIALHLIVTPEYLKRMTKDHPEVEIFALRLDRGLSKPEVFKTVPGEKIDEERGLNDIQYIVPGGGGFGELMNNSPK